MTIESNTAKFAAADKHSSVARQDTRYSVVVNHALDEDLERLLSPMDELVFLSQLDNQLTKLHRPKTSPRFNWLGRSSLHLYRGLAEWCGIHFLYVEFDNRLHILRFEPSLEDDSDHADTLLDEPDAESVTIEDFGNGIAIASY